MKSIPLTLISAALICGVSAQNTAAYETAVMLDASQVLPADQLQGPCHRVRDQVFTDGFMAHFTIDTDFGTFSAVGVPQVQQRISETEAIRTLVNTSKSDLFAEGMKRSIEQPIDAVKNIVQNPVGSVKQAPKTVGHFFSKVGASIGRGAEKVKKKAEAGQSPSADEIGESAKNVAGFDKARLNTARQLGVDPYSDNARLQDEMNKVTWAFFAGGLPLRIGAAVASAGVALTATNMVGVPEETYALTQSELALRDQKSLTTMGIREDDIKNFHLQPNLSTTRRHRIVKSLETLSNCAGRGRIILLANSCETPEQADFLVAALSMLENRQLAGAADYKELKVLGRLPAAITSQGTLEVPAPVDHVTWTEQVAAFATRDDLGPEPKSLIHTGKLSDQTRLGLKTAGWTTNAVAYSR